MAESGHPSNAPYDGSALIADPIHQYVSFTVPFSVADPHERTEKDLIDSPWVQRQIGRASCRERVCTLV